MLALPAEDGAGSYSDNCKRDLVSFFVKSGGKATLKLITKEFKKIVRRRLCRLVGFAFAHRRCVLQMAVRGEQAKDVLTQHLAALTRKDGAGETAQWVLKKECYPAL